MWVRAAILAMNLMTAAKRAQEYKKGRKE